MPAERLSDSPIAVRKYDLAGQDSASVHEFVRHVGLALLDYDSVTSQLPAVRLLHMAPPILKDGDEDATPVQTIATVELTADEQRQIEIFADEHDSEFDANGQRRPIFQYVICPHTKDPDEKTPFRRFNCAGFAIEAYRQAGLVLLIDHIASLPKVTLDVLKKAYPDQADELDRAGIRQYLGLEGEGPWPVLLAGYVINAMDRDSDSIRKAPYAAKVGDEYFPSQAASQSDAG